jgi:NAD+ synthase
MKKLAERLIDGLSKMLESTTMKGYVLGLSGGVDSALSAALCARAVGQANVYTYMLPYKASSAESRRDAELVAHTLGINLDEVDITPMADAYGLITPGMTAGRLGNILSRLRMTVIFDKSVQHNALVAGTSNRSEILLGYTTWFGDNACAVNPLGNLYKTEVWQLAAYMGVPKKVVEKVPTADLIPGQTDEGDLGYSYKELDKLLMYLESGKSADEAVREGFDADFVKMVARRIKANAFKRELPKIL